MEQQPDEPFEFEPDGTYITISQIGFFLNREFGEKLLEYRSRTYLRYYNVCRAYNLISDIVEDNPEAAMFYWNEEKGGVSISYPRIGIVATALEGMQLITEDKNE